MSIRAVEEVMMRDRQISVRLITDELNISTTSLYEIMSDYLGMKKVCTRWVPKPLIPLQRANRVDCCEELLEKYDRDPTGSIARIVTRDETRIHHYGLFSQHEAKIWKKLGEKTPSRRRGTRSATKIIMILFWGCEGVFLVVDFLPHGTTINGS